MLSTSVQAPTMLGWLLRVEAVLAQWRRIWPLSVAQMGVNQIGREVRDGFQLGTLGEGKQECGGCWGTN